MARLSSRRGFVYSGFGVCREGWSIGFGRIDGGGGAGALWTGECAFSSSRDPASIVSETIELALVSSLFFVSVLSSLLFFCKMESMLNDFEVVGDALDSGFGFSIGT